MVSMQKIFQKEIFMKPGLSTACFYPMQTEEALAKVGQLGFLTTEVFFNSTSELNKDFLKHLRRIQEQYGVRMNSIHPMASFAESYMLFSTYIRRFFDTVEMYKYYFEAANFLGAKIVVIHGSKAPGIIEPQEYYERFGTLIDEGLKQGIVVAHENVVSTMGQSPELMLDMKNAIGDNFKMVLDIKQAIRSGYDPNDFVDILGDRIVQVHISDHNEENDCLPPGEGNFNFKKFTYNLNNKGYNGDYIIELYKNSFCCEEQLLLAKKHIEKLI